MERKKRHDKHKKSRDSIKEKTTFCFLFLLIIYYFSKEFEYLFPQQNLVKCTEYSTPNISIFSLFPACLCFFFLSFSERLLHFASEGDPTDGMVLEVNVRLRDEDGARWMHNETPKEKGISVEFLEFCGDGPGCDILSPSNIALKKSDGSYRFVDDDNTKRNCWARRHSFSRKRWKIWNKRRYVLYSSRGIFPFRGSKDKLDALDVVTIKLTDAADNSVSFEGDDPDREASTLKTITKSLSLDKDQKGKSGSTGRRDVIFVTNDDKLSRLLIGSIPVGGVSVYDQFITNVGQFFRRSAAMLGWALEITNEGYRNGKIEALALVIRNIVNGLIILAIMGIAALWIFPLLFRRKWYGEVQRLFLSPPLSSTSPCR